MKNAIRTLPGLISCALLLAACGGGSGGTSLPFSTATTTPAQTPTPTSLPQTSTKAVVTIDGGADTAQRLIVAHDLRASGGRRPMYVSSSTAGITITVNGTTTAYNVSAGSPLCTTGSPRTCTLAVVAPVGSDTFSLNEYDAAPVSGSIPGTARELATTTLTQTIVANTANAINFVVSGIIKGVATSGGVVYGSLSADGAAHTYSVALINTDADGNTITGSAAYSNPITVSITETGGSGHSYLVKNGLNVGTSATLSYPSDTISLHYDGGGSPGYTTSTGFAASGATGTTLRVSPMYVSGGFAATDAGQANTATVTEAGAPANVAYSTGGWSCVGFSAASVSGSGASASVSITSPGAVAGSSLLSTYSCGTNITISDNYGSSITKSVSASIPTVATCSNQSSNIYLGVKNGSSQYEVGSGAPCALSVGTTSGTIYTSGSTPTSFTSAISEANDSASMSLSGCSGIASLSTTSISGGSGYTGTASATLTVSSSAVGTCSITVNDNHSQTKTISVTVNQGTVTLVQTNPAVTVSAGDPCSPDPIDGIDCPPSSIAYDIGNATFTTSASYLAVNVTQTDEANGGGYDCIVLHEWSGSTNYFYELASPGGDPPGYVTTYNQSFANPHPGWSAEVWGENDSPGLNNSHIGDVYASESLSGTVSTAGSANATLGAAVTSFSTCF